MVLLLHETYALQLPVSQLYLFLNFCQGAMRTVDATELTYARQKIVMVAKAYRIQAIDMVFTDYKGWYSCTGAADDLDGTCVLQKF